MVDLFFILSGYVIALTYNARLYSGMTFREFAIRCFVRLYPTLFLWAILAAIVCLIDLRFRPIHAVELADVPTAFLLRSSILVPGRAIWRAPLPMNPVSWSLFFELVAKPCTSSLFAG